ncbi:MAG: hypothetical protein JW818_17170 [Pirellulales bacterium]|nr:hypothetical protein [Pirellulales bacterium]
MGRMLDALKQLEGQADVTEPTLPVETVSTETIAVAPLEPVTVTEPEPMTAAEPEPVVKPAPPIVFAEPVAAVPEPPDPPAGRRPRPPADPRFDAIADSILPHLSNGRRAVFLFTCTPDEPTSGGQLAPLYRALATRIEGPTVAVDCDLHQPSLARRFGLRATIGMTDVLSGRVPWQAAVVETTCSGLSVLPGVDVNATRPRPIELVSLIGELQSHHQLVLLDGTLSTDADIAALAGMCTGVYILVWLDQTPQRRAAQTLRAIQQRGGTVLGSILLESA